MSPEQKEQRRIATNARNRAYSARLRECGVAEAAAKAQVDARFADSIKAAGDAERVVEAERDAALAEIDRQIAELKSQRSALQNDYAAKYAEARKVSSAVWAQRTQAHDELKAEVDAKFPDLQGWARGSAACWKSIEEFLP